MFEYIMFNKFAYQYCESVLKITKQMKQFAYHLSEGCIVQFHGQKWSPTWLPSMRILTQNKIQNGVLYNLNGNNVKLVFLITYG